MLDIKHLSEYPEHIELVTKWLWQEWGNKDNYKRYESIIRHSLSKENLPQTFVALMDGKPVATVGLWRCDLMSRQDLYPWLASLYVKPEFRSQGIGTKLQRFLIRYAHDLGYEEVYLYTNIEGYYEKTGWEFLTTALTDGMETINIYRTNTKI